ncbi:hypothetical protein PC129_g21652 [Phytophthora cactorum]|uniref:Uncharacterized protein n=1 Tax=Phytophthora cactorum TaxID=29920 RepID=A0A329S8Z0_9STRA|nr:hypothetical protein PC113_g22159 [Phytophthora cactorum]KAG2876052.1 hypothetical protein PC114_g24392 [Phytophthora cactorum]KAG2881893.1 hypothetical protein PC115_g22093 [Phytophthora cactorum]KAG2889894.1 hypothetical protein PC117_g24605 [Phytophthora cactorum]KAG3142133.1 hypothetical protein PC128_g24844 [Phytophthora cactorum]
MAAGYDICYTVGIFAAQECLMYRTCSAAWDIVIATTISTLTRKNMRSYNDVKDCNVRIRRQFGLTSTK